jgi:hypothetical protein
MGEFETSGRREVAQRCISPGRVITSRLPEPAGHETISWMVSASFGSHVALFNVQEAN